MSAMDRQAQDALDAPQTAPEVAADEACEGAADEREALKQQILENNALAKVFLDVANASASGILSTPARWEQLGLVPDHMSAEDLEMAVYDFLQELIDHDAESDSARAMADFWADPLASQQRAVRPQDREGEAASGSVERPVERPKKRSAFASRAVGVAPSFRTSTASQQAGETGDDHSPSADVQEAIASADDAHREAPLPNEEESRLTAEQGGPSDKGPSDTVASQQHDELVTDLDIEESDDPFANLDIPDGYELTQLDDGEWVLLQTEADPLPKKMDIDAAHARLLMGASGYYLYDERHMTDAFARWAFLAAEDDPLVTFVYCVREESRVYPRPMDAASFANAPFRFGKEEVAELFEQASQNPDFADIRRVSASNGDTYYYSTWFMDETRAQALAEWYSIGKHMNV